MFKTKLIKMNQWPLKNKIRYRIKFKMMLRTAKTTLKKRWRRNGQFLLWNGQRKLLFSAAFLKQKFCQSNIKSTMR